MKQPRFEFSIPGMTKGQADYLLYIVLHVIELLGLTMVGGFHMEDEGSDEQKQNA